MKKTSTIVFVNFLVSFAILLGLSASRVAAQTKPGSAETAQNTQVPARIIQAIDETQLVTLKGNVHPLARAEFDQGTVSDAMPATRMLLLLHRSAGQEAALRQLLHQQQDKASPNYRAWLM